jgi:hypothetical protein
MRRNREQGLIITLVAVFLLFVVGGMAALSIDVVTLYTARSEAQLTADAAALAGARVLANSGATSDTTGNSMSSAWTQAVSVATQVAMQNKVAGTNVTAAQVIIPATYPSGMSISNPVFSVQIQVPTLPVYFARMLGVINLAVSASSTAEVYNPSPATITAATGPPVAPLCVKPWLLPNIDPTNASSATTIFNASNGAITNPALLGQSWPNTNPTPNPDGLYALCSNCSTGIPVPSAGGFYPVAVEATAPPTTAGDFVAPTILPSCSSSFGINYYQLAIAGCMPLPISCGTIVTSTTTTNPNLNIDVAAYGGGPNRRDKDTVEAAECLINYGGPGESDSIDPTYNVPPFQFVAGSQNPVVNARGKDVMVSDSIVTLPVINYPGTSPAPTVGNPSVTVIGFVQVFLNSSATQALPYHNPAHPNRWEIPATIINMAGCGTNSTVTAPAGPILGNGSSPVTVRMISSPSSPQSP